jgi:hypothetical protein
MHRRPLFYFYASVQWFGLTVNRVMASPKCVAAVSAAAGKDLSQAEIEAIEKAVLRERQKRAAKALTDSDPEAFAAAAQKLADEGKLAAIIESGAALSTCCGSESASPSIVPTSAKKRKCSAPSMSAPTASASASPDWSMPSVSASGIPRSDRLRTS